MRQVVMILVVCGCIGFANADIPTTGLQLHLDASSLTGYNDGAVVSTWPDLAGGNNNATSTGTPTYIANGLNGKPIIKITGTSDRDGYGTVGNPPEYDFYHFPTVYNVKTIAFVFKPTSNTYWTWSTILSGPTGNNYYWHGDAHFGNAYWDYAYTKNSIANSNLAVDGKGGFNGGYTGVDYDNFRVITINLADQDQVDLAYLAHTARYNDYNEYGMELAELLIYDQHLSAAELEELQFSLALKWDLWGAKPTSPEDKQGNIPVNDKLSWQAYNASWGADVYLDPNETYVAAGDASVKIVDNQVVSTVDPGTLKFDTTYYWRVDVYEPNTMGSGYILHKGPVWSFTTLPPNPLITTQPVSQTVNSGDAVTLSIAGENLESYQWYLNGAAVSGATGATLQIASLGIAGEGVYTCVASNASGSVTSDPAIVVSKRLMGWWKLDGDLTDSVDTVVTGALTHDGSIADPNFAAGKNGNAYQFFQDNRVITIADSSDFFNFYPQGLTVSAWMKTSQTGWGGLVSKIDSTDSQGFFLTHTGGWLVGGIRSLGDLYHWVNDTTTWQLLTLTLDPDTSTIKEYVNGEIRQQSVYSTGTPPVSPEALYFGAQSADGADFPYVGLLDDVHIWSYPLDAVTIAHLYTDVTEGGEVCAGYSIFDVSGPLGQPDCRVDLYDFAAAAAEWLDCNLVPTCIN